MDMSESINKSQARKSRCSFYGLVCICLSVCQLFENPLRLFYSVAFSPSLPIPPPTPTHKFALVYTM